MALPPSVYAIAPQYFDGVYPPAVRAELNKLVRLPERCYPRDDFTQHPDLLREVEVIMAGWGGPPVLDPAILDAAPRLRLVCYAAGSVRHFTTDAMWDRGVRVTHAASQNALPVAEFTLAHVILALKKALPVMRDSRRRRMNIRNSDVRGAYGARVGIVSLGLIGRLVVERLAALDVETLIYDIHEDADFAARHGARYAPLDELFATCDVVSLHTPLLDETRGMIHEGLVRALPTGATLLNTARGAIIDEPALVRVLRERPDLTAVLDVTHPEPPPEDSPLWDLDNVFIFPHIAGAMGGEIARLGEAMVGELGRYLTGKPLRHEVTRENLAAMA